MFEFSKFKIFENKCLKKTTSTIAIQLASRSFWSHFETKKLLSVIGQSRVDNELKKEIRKFNKTIETITNLVHEHMYDRLNDSNNSNDGTEKKLVQERPYKRKWSKKSSQ